MALLQVENLTFTYPLAEAPTLHKISFEVEAGAFVGVCGATGSGKSTLMRLMKRELAPLGQQEGRVFLDGVALDDLPPKEAAFSVGYVMQRPEQQLVTDKVWHELAFGLENMGLPQQEIARRVAEMAAYFGMESWFDQSVGSLSGGQKQLLNLAAVMVMHPRLLILDEPTAQLDPIAAADFIATLHRLNRDMGLTLLVIEHRLEEIVPLCDQLLVLKAGHLLCCDTPRQAVSQMADKPELLCAMPAASRLYHALGAAGECPLSIREGRALVSAYASQMDALPTDNSPVPGTPALEMEDVFFRYEKAAPDVLRGLSLTVHEGEILCLLGGNGSGKTTALSVAAGLNSPHHGRIRVLGKKLQSYRNQALYRNCLTLLPQDVQTVFLRNTVREELKDAQAGVKLLPFDLSLLMDRHPYDLSGGEQQLVALALVLATQPRILLLDEPTKGIDMAAKLRLIHILRHLRADGMALLIVTHDVEFAALCADRCAMLFRGEMISQGDPRSFFGSNSFYTTAASRLTRGQYKNAVTVEDAAELCRLNGRKADV